MSPRLKYALIALAVLFFANVGWRIWSNWGLITIDATDAPIADVVRSVEKQGGVKLRTNLPSDTKVTVHARKVSLIAAMDRLSGATGANWSVAYFTGPNKIAIDSALGVFANGDEMKDWKRYSFPAPRGMGLDDGLTDPRTDEWKVEKPGDGTLHTLLEQGAQWASAQFWVPEQWNPTVGNPPKPGAIHSVLPKLAKAAGGQSEEVFLLTGRRQREVAENAPPDGEQGEGRGRGRFGPPNDDMRRIMEERMRAQIDKLPADKKAEALAELDERKKFFEEMSQLTPEQRREKIQERMESEMNNSDRAQKFENGMTKRGAMQTAEQRAQRNQRYLDRKRQATQ